MAVRKYHSLSIASSNEFSLPLGTGNGMSWDPFAENPEHPDHIDNLWQQVVGRGRLLLLSHRGPWEYVDNGHGYVERRRGGGGLVTALSPMADYGPVTWVAAPLSSADRNNGSDHQDGETVLRWITAPEESHRLHYQVFSNPILWFVQHSLRAALHPYRLTQQTEMAWDRGYVPVNRAFAQAAIDELRAWGGEGAVMIHDYHLYLAPLFIRRSCPGALLLHFLHIPWPPPWEWECMPRWIVQEICQGLLACDIAGFQTEQDRDNFLETCEHYVFESRVDWVERKVLSGRHETRARTYPISVDVAAVAALARSPAATTSRDSLRKLCPGQVVLKVDRMDPSKNIAAGFEAFERLLRRRPDLQGKVHLLALLVPSRSEIPEYAAYSQQVLSLIARINKTYETPEWEPIVLRHENNYLQAIAAMGLYDVLLVNSLADGMNLVAKEGPVANDRDGVLILSRETGAYRQLQNGALSIDPRDVEGTSRALEAALAMPLNERRIRAHLLKSRIEREDLSVWLEAQLADMAAVARSRGLVLARG